MKAAPTRRVRREPVFFYKSATATIEGKVRFGEGCVVLPHARITVPPGYFLEVGPFTLFADFAEVTVTPPPPAPSSSHAAAAGTSRGASPPPTVLRFDSHNHIQSYARLHFQLLLPQSTLQVSPRDARTSRTRETGAAANVVELMGTGNVFHSFASLHARLSIPALHPASCANDSGAPAMAPPPSVWRLGDFNIFTAYTNVLLPGPSSSSPSPAATVETPSPRTASAQTWRQGGGEGRGTFFSPTPTMPQAAGTREPASTGLVDGATPPSVAHSMPGRVSVEERLFQDPSSDDDDTVGGEATKGLFSPPSSLPVASCSAVGGAPSPRSPHAEAATTPTTTTSTARVSSVVYFASCTTPLADTAACGATALGLPRYGTRSVSELPTIIKRILDEEKQRREVDDEHHRKPQHGGAAPSVESPAPSSPIAAAAATLVSLEGYVEDVHPDLRAHEEGQTLVEVERVCRFYIRQYIEDANLYPVERQDTEGEGGATLHVHGSGQHQTIGAG